MSALTLVCFVGLAVVWSWPLLGSPNTSIPGAGFGDNIGFLWDAWWARVALRQPLAGFFFCRYLGAPYGVNLAQHSHWALPSLIGAVLGGTLPLPLATNLILLASLALNGWLVCLLARRVTHDWPSALLAGVVFAASPYFLAHLQGHFNLVSAWVIPLFVLAWLRLRETWRVRHGVWAGLALGIAAWTDSYYAVYCVVFAIAWSLPDLVEVYRVPARSRLARVLRRLAVVTAVASVVVALAIAVSGGGQFFFADTAVSATEIENPLRLLGVAVVVWALASTRRRLRWRLAPQPWFRVGTSLAGAAVAATVVLAPVLAASIRLWHDGAYATQVYGWRTAPRGLDVMSLLGGNPYHAALAGPLSAWYAAWHLDRIEQVGWIGIVPLALVLAWAIRAHRHAAVNPSDPGPIGNEGRWALSAGIFLIWALGPELFVAGRSLGLLLPGILLRYVPLVANARMPGRALVMVQLAVAVLCALQAARLRTRGRWIIPLLVVGVLADFWPAALPTTSLPVETSVERWLETVGASGTICELPLGLRDGFGELGTLDHRSLYYQTMHERPMLGGFVARAPVSLRNAYLGEPGIKRLFELSSAGPAAVPRPGDAAAIGSGLRALDARWIVVNVATTPAPLMHLVDQLAGQPLVANLDRRLYVVPPPEAGAVGVERR
jgi:hypothetical protein